jgi:hypothetical protein
MRNVYVARCTGSVQKTSSKMYSTVDGDVRWSHNSDEKSTWFYILFKGEFSTIDPVIYCTQSVATQSSIGRTDGNKLVKVFHIALNNLSIHFDDEK